MGCRHCYYAASVIRIFLVLASYSGVSPSWLV